MRKWSARKDTEKGFYQQNTGLYYLTYGQQVMTKPLYSKDEAKLICLKKNT